MSAPQTDQHPVRFNHRDAAPADAAPMRPAEQVFKFVADAFAARCAYLVAKFALADHLAPEPKTAGQVAELTQTHAPSMYRLLRAAAGIGLMTEDDAGRFTLTPAGQVLRTDAPGTLRWTVLSELSPEFTSAWNEASFSIKTGKVAAEKAFGCGIWEYFSRHPEPAEIFNRSMTGFTAAIEPAVLAAYDFAGIRKLIDVGGGHGSLLCAILQKNPAMQGVVFDLPQVVDGATPRIRDAGLADRCTTASGSFFESVPAGADGIVMKFILHDWSDEQSKTILRNCHNALTPNGKLLLVETVIPRGNEPHMGKLMDLHMMVMCGGRERTASEWIVLLAETGFRLTSITPTESGVSVIEAVKA